MPAGGVEKVKGSKAAAEGLAGLEAAAFKGLWFLGLRLACGESAARIAKGSASAFWGVGARGSASPILLSPPAASKNLLRLSSITSYAEARSPETDDWRHALML